MGERGWVVSHRGILSEWGRTLQGSPRAPLAPEPKEALKTSLFRPEVQEFYSLDLLRAWSSLAMLTLVGTSRQLRETHSSLGD